MGTERRAPRMKATRNHEQLGPTTAYYATLHRLGLYFWVEDDVEIEGFGPETGLTFIQGYGARPLTVRLSEFTLAELEVFEQIIGEAIALVKPICEARDKRAKEIYDDTDATFDRLYRAVPTMVTTARARALDSEELLRRPVNVPKAERAT